MVHKELGLSLSRSKGKFPKCYEIGIIAIDPTDRKRKDINLLAYLSTKLLSTMFHVGLAYNVSIQYTY